MFISVRGSSVIPEASGRRQLFELSVMSHVSGVLGNHGVLTIVALVVILLITGMVSQPSGRVRRPDAPPRSMCSTTCCGGGTERPPGGTVPGWLDAGRTPRLSSPRPGTA